MKKRIPDCEHKNEYEFDDSLGGSLVLTNETNRIYLSKQDFFQLVKLSNEGFCMKKEFKEGV
jgi:hypothetical protein